VAVYDAPWVGPGVRTHVDAHRIIHGNMNPNTLPRDYRLAFVPGDAAFAPFSGTISSNYNIIKILVSLGQALFGISTLYLTRGDQIDQYGYAAFGLTVAPYAIMSLVNLLGNTITPDYAAIYVVRNSVMDEAVQRHQIRFEGVIGELIEDGSRRMSLERKAGGVQMLGDWDVETVLIEDSNVGHLSAQVLPRQQQQPQAADIEVPAQADPQGAPPNAIALDDLQNAVPGPDNMDRAHYEIQKALAITEIPTDAEQETGQSPTTRILVPSCPSFQSTSAPIGEPERYLIRKISYCPQKSQWKLSTLGPETWLSSRIAISEGLAIWISMIPVAIVGGMTHFLAGTSSTMAARGFTMAWLGCGIMFGQIVAQLNRPGDRLASFGPIFRSSEKLERLRHLNGVRGGGYEEENGEGRAAEDRPGQAHWQWIVWGLKVYLLFGILVAAVLYSAPAIGGAVVVGLQLAEYGTCVHV
jgi:hypothetical protein